LSSSPPRPDAEDLHQAGKEGIDPGSPTKQTSSSFAPASGFRPASTFHTTSMNQVQNQSAQRKTLGARRSMQPWSVKHNAMPKPRPS
jgi:DNA helicase-2/ATP-dependent DNA helicase PcrA